MVREFPRCQKLYKPPRYAEVYHKMSAKLEKVHHRQYTALGDVSSMMKCFAVRNGEKGIWVVYNRINRGMNNILWDPHFSLPMVQTKLRLFKSRTYMVYREIGEKLLNFMLVNKC